jgi:hypothetical protein
MVTPFPNMVYFRPGRLDSFVPYSSTGRSLSSSTYPYPYPPYSSILFRNTPNTAFRQIPWLYCIFNHPLRSLHHNIHPRMYARRIRHQRVSFYSRSLRPPELSPGPGAEERRTPSAFVSWVQPVQSPRFWPILCTSMAKHGCRIPYSALTSIFGVACLLIGMEEQYVSRQTDFQTTQHVNQDDWLVQRVHLTSVSHANLLMCNSRSFGASIE